MFSLFLQAKPHWQDVVWENEDDGKSRLVVTGERVTERDPEQCVFCDQSLAKESSAKILSHFSDNHTDQFSLVFTLNTGGRFFCKLCRVFVPPSVFNSHILSHLDHNLSNVENVEMLRMVHTETREAKKILMSREEAQKHRKVSDSAKTVLFYFCAICDFTQRDVDMKQVNRQPLSVLLFIRVFITTVTP